MMAKTGLALLLVVGAFATPASANYFSNPYTGVTLNIGSAPNPTPADIRLDRLPAITQDDSNTAQPATASNGTDRNPAPVAQNPAPAASGSGAVPTASQSR